MYSQLLRLTSSSNHVLVTSRVSQSTVKHSVLYINDISMNIISSKLGLFADDSVIYKTIYSKVDSIALYNDLSALSDWARIWKMNFNVD